MFLSDPSPEEMAAITAAIEVLWPRPQADVETPDDSPTWRFSGRWWNKPIVARRERPWS